MDENQKYFSHLNDTAENIRSQTLATIEKLVRASFEATWSRNTNYYDFSVALAALLTETSLTHQLLHKILKTQIVTFAKVIEQHQQVMQQLQTKFITDGFLSFQTTRSDELALSIRAPMWSISWRHTVYLSTRINHR